MCTFLHLMATAILLGHCNDIVFSALTLLVRSNKGTDYTIKMSGTFVVNKVTVNKKLLRKLQTILNKQANLLKTTVVYRFQHEGKSSKPMCSIFHSSKQE